LILDLVALLISENDLRSALTARLTMIGINVVTIGPDQVARNMPGTVVTTAVLITDDVPLGQTAAAGSPAWLQVIILNGSSSSLDERPVRLARRDATRRVVDVLDGWRTPNPSQ
jgi:hypothetical protein